MVVEVMSWSSFFHNTGVGHMHAEALQQRIRRHAGEELHARRLQPINKPSNFNHLSPSFHMRGTSHITICAALHARHLQSTTNKPVSYLLTKQIKNFFIRYCKFVASLLINGKPLCSRSATFHAYFPLFPQLSQGRLARTTWQGTSKLLQV